MRKLLGLLCVLLLALVAVGCGSSGGSEDGGGDTTTTGAEATTTTPDDDTTAAEGDEADYLDAIRSNLTTGSEEDQNLVIADGEGDCVAPVWLEVITVAGFASVDASADDVSDPGFSYEDLELDADQAQALIDAFEPCGVDIYAKLAESFTQGLSEEQQACAMEEIDPEIANALLLTAFSTEAGDGGTEFAAMIEQLTEACDLPET
jgi:hypothetical protein